MQNGDCTSEALIVSLSISHVARFNRCGRALRGSVLGLASAQLGMSARNDELKGVRRCVAERCPRPPRTDRPTERALVKLAQPSQRTTLVPGIT